MGMFKKMTASLGHAAAPIGVLAAICSVALMVGAHTATLQILRSPAVQVMKKNRDSVPEVENPDAAIRSGDKLINTSFLRKVGHLQENQYGDDNAGTNIYTRYVLIIINWFIFIYIYCNIISFVYACSSRETDTLRTVGVIGKK